MTYRALSLVALSLSMSASADTLQDRVATVTKTPGLVAFWDFVRREEGGEKRFLAHVAAGATNEYALDAANYVKDYWGAGPEATYADFPLMGRGPFGEAIRIRAEEDPDFRPFLHVPRSRLHDSPLDIKGAGKSVTVVVRAIRIRSSSSNRACCISVRHNRFRSSTTWSRSRPTAASAAPGSTPPR